jgi:hypothetical protein
VKFRLISEHTIERRQTCPTKQVGEVVFASDSDSETDGEDDGEDDDEIDHPARGAAVAGIPFKVNPFVDLKSAGLVDMVAQSCFREPDQGAISNWTTRNWSPAHG